MDDSTMAAAVTRTRAQTVHWDLDITAASSISHAGQVRGGVTLLRREVVVMPDGTAGFVPIISGNSLRGRLRRIGEQLLREVLEYDGKLSPAVAHALRGGGSLTKATGEPLSGSRLAKLRALVPQVGVFGAAGGGRIIDGCLQVGKVLPLVREVEHLLRPDMRGVERLRSFDATQLESYVRHDDSDRHDFANVLYDPETAEVEPLSEVVPVDAEGLPDLTAAGSSQASMFRVETFPAGQRFAGWVRVERATETERAFFADVLATYIDRGHLGGRIAAGHGSVTVEAHRHGPDSDIDWRACLREGADEALAALEGLR